MHTYLMDVRMRANTSTHTLSHTVPSMSHPCPIHVPSMHAMFCSYNCRVFLPHQTGPGEHVLCDGHLHWRPLHPGPRPWLRYDCHLGKRRVGFLSGTTYQSTVWWIRSGQVRSSQVRSECLTCTFRASCCSAGLSRAQVPVFVVGSSVRDRRMMDWWWMDKYTNGQLVSWMDTLWEGGREERPGDR